MYGNTNAIQLLKTIASVTLGEEVLLAVVIGIEIFAECLRTNLHQSIQLLTVQKNGLQTRHSFKHTKLATKHSNILHHLRKLDKSRYHFVVGILVFPLKAVRVRNMRLIVIIS